MSQYRLLRQDAALLQLLNQLINGVPLIALLHWQREPALQERFPLPKALGAYRSWWGQHAAGQLSHLPFNSHGEITAEPWKEEPRLAPEQRPFGVNLIGHAFEVFGIGEDVRMAALALESAGVPFCVVNVPARNGAWIAREGLAQQRGRTSIVAWPWETQTWPQVWECMIPLADGL